MKSWFLSSILLLLCASPSLAQWSEVFYPPNTTSVYLQPYFLNENVGFIFRAGLIFANVQITTQASPRLCRTTDGGASWVQLPQLDMMSLQVAGMSFVSLTHGYLAAIASDSALPASIGGGIYETWDAGDNWKKITPGDLSYSSVYASGSRIFATECKTKTLSLPIIPGILSMTSDDGKTWSSASTINGIALGTSPNFLYVTGNKEGLVTASYLDSVRETFLVYSTDLGTTWTSHLLDPNHPWDMLTLFVYPHTTHVIREYLPDRDVASDVYSFLRSTLVDTNWLPSVSHLETGAWVAGTSCASYLSLASDTTHSRGLTRSTDYGATWKYVGGPNCTEIDDGDFQNLSVVGYGAVVYGVDVTGRLWKTTNGGDGTLSTNTLSPRFRTQHFLVPTNSDALTLRACDTTQLQFIYQNLNCSITSLAQFDIVGLDPTEYTIHAIHHLGSLGIPDTVYTTITPSKPGVRSVTVTATFVDDEFATIPLSFNLVLTVQPPPTVQVSVYMKSGQLTSSSGETIQIPLYINSSQATTLGSSSIGVTYAMNTWVLSPLEFIPSLSGLTASPMSFNNNEATFILKSATPLTINGEALLGWLKCVVVLSDSSRTTVTIPNVTIGTTNVRCLSQFVNSDSILFTRKYGCGDSTLLKFMGGVPPGTIISINPNPARTMLHIQLQNLAQQTVAYALYDPLGVRVIYGTTTGSDLEINLESLSSGVYYFRSMSAAGSPSTRRIVIAK